MVELTTYVLTVSVTTLRTGVLRGPAADSRDVGASIGGGGTEGGSSEAGGGREGTGGVIIGGGGGVRGRFPGPDFGIEILGTGVLGSEFGTTLLITLGREKQDQNVIVE